mmetsp:Transcript_1553/g.2545  ORF Transcript_1553/g.2545 Transcript_1553/m.2545 type:complete len:224 (+) Transcript_1553:1155-1826(+)
MRIMTSNSSGSISSVSLRKPSEMFSKSSLERWTLGFRSSFLSPSRNFEKFNLPDKSVSNTRKSWPIRLDKSAEVSYVRANFSNTGSRACKTVRALFCLSSALRVLSVIVAEMKLSSRTATMTFTITQSTMTTKVKRYKTTPKSILPRSSKAGSSLAASQSFNAANTNNVKQARARVPKWSYDLSAHMDTPKIAKISTINSPRKKALATGMIETAIASITLLIF